MSNGKNVIWFIADQMRADAMSCNGNPDINTPNLDLLSAQGMNFEHAVSGCPLCAPFRGSLITSQYVHKSTVPGHDYSLDPKMPTIADVFAGEGYDTLYFGKWHMDGEIPRRGTDVDPKKQIVGRERRARFKTWIGYENNNSQFDCWVHGHDGDTEIGLTRLKGFETDALSDMVIDKIHQYGEKRRGGQNVPFFMVLSVQPPHDPYTAPAEFMARHNGQTLKMRPNVPPYRKIRETAGRELAGYYALIENIDYNLGRIREALRDEELDLDTHIIFFSDHGDMHGSHGMFRKTNPYEESVRIPFIIGGEMPMGYYGRRCGRSESVINHVDIAPTTLGLCGIDAPEWMQGYDYSFERLPGTRKPKGTPPEEAYLQSVIPTRHDHSIDKPWRGIVTKDGYKYVCLEGQDWLMFDLNEDPYELVNLAHHPLAAAKRAQLNEKLKKWVDDTDDSFKVPDLEYRSFPTEYFVDEDWGRHRLKAVIFDLDGVITDSARYHYLAWKALADELGIPFDEEYNEKLKGVSRLESLELILKNGNMCGRFTPEEKERMAEKKNENYVNLIRRMTPQDILPGILKFLDELKTRGIKTALASVSRNAEFILKQLGISERFDYIADAGAVGRAKPFPDIFLAGVNTFGFRPEECIGVEDARTGVEAIHRAGMKAVGVGTPAEMEEADLVLTTGQLKLARILDELHMTV